MGVPLLYTMEVWQFGQTAGSRHAIIALLVTFVPVYLLVATSGFRRRPDFTRVDIVVDMVTAVGLAVISVAAVLIILQRITLATPLATAAQMIVFEAAPFAIGAAVATEVFTQAKDQREHQPGDRGAEQGDQDWPGRATLRDLAATAVGGAFIGLSIAPTDEVPMLAAGIEAPWLLVLVGACLVVTYAIVFTAGFADEKGRREQIGVLQRPVTETAAAYVVSLGVSVAMLWLFGNLGDPLGAGLAHTVVLSFPTSIGGAAGRLVV